MKSQSIAALEHAGLNGFRKGIKLAADIADQYNSLSLHGFKLGDCIQGKLNFSRKHPRRNLASPALLVGCKHKLLEVKQTDEQVLQMAMAIAPKFWAEYIENKGRITDMVFWECVESIETAQRLITAGFRDCAPSRPELPKWFKSVVRLASGARKNSTAKPRRRAV